MGEQESNLQSLLIFVNDFLKENHLDSKKIATFTGDGVFIVFQDNTFLPLRLAISLHHTFRKPKMHNNFKFKIGIAYGTSNTIGEAEKINGLPYWGEASTIAKRLCDLCDAYHILINDKAERQFRELVNADPNFLLGQEYEEVFQDIGVYYVKHKQKIEVFNFYLHSEDQIVGNLSLPLDKRGIIDRLPVAEKLARPLDSFFEKEAYKLVSRVDSEEGIILFINSAKKLYEALFEEATDYYGINKTLPSEFFEYNQHFLTRHAELIRANKKKYGIRIMLMTKEEIRRDWYCNNTRISNTNFIRFHMDNNIKLLQIDPYAVQEFIMPNLVLKYNSFYLQSNHIGIWKNRYVVLFGKLDLKNSVNITNSSRLGIGKFWIFSESSPVYTYCEEFFHELLNYQKIEINELSLDYLNRPKFTRWKGEDVER